MILKKGIQLYIKILLILLFVCFFGLFSSSYAVSFEDFRQAVSDKADEYPNNNYFKSAKNFMNSSPLYNYLSSNDLFYLFEDYETIVFGCSESGTSYGRIYFMTPNSNFSFNGNNITFTSSNYKKLSMFYSGGVGPWQQFSLSDMTNQTQFRYTMGSGYNNTLYMIYTNRSFVENTNSNAYNGLVTLDISSFFIDNNYNDIVVDSSDYTSLPINYRNNYTYLGNIQGVVTDMHYINLNLSQVNGAWQEKNTYYSDINSNTNSNFYITNDYDIYISTRLLNAGLKLVLYVDAFRDSSFTDLVNYASVNYYVVYYNAVISGDSVLNIGSGDYDIQDNTNAIIGSLTGFNPINSGDIISNISVNPSYTNPQLYNFFYDFLQHISDVFLLDDEVTLSLNLPIYNRQINIRSDFWITKNYLGQQFYDFIQGAWWVLICTLIVYKVDLLVELFNFGDFIGAMGEIYQTRRLL